MTTAIIFSITDMQHPVTKYMHYLNALTLGISTVCPRYTINHSSFKNSINSVIPNDIVFNFILDPDDRDIEVNVRIHTNCAEITYDHDMVTSVYITDDDVSPIFDFVSSQFDEPIVGDFVVRGVTDKQRIELEKLVNTF